MPSHDREALRKTYYALMKHHGGHALIEPPSTSLLKPGAVGYFNDYGRWNTVFADLADTQSLEQKGFKPPSQELERVPEDRDIEWGPKRSWAVEGKKLKLAGDGSIPGIPVEAKAIFEYWSNSENGAILMTASPVIRQGYFHEYVFSDWVNENALNISEKYPEVVKYGLWIIGTTFSTKYCSHNIWQSKGKTVKVGFGVNAAGVRGMGPAGEWYEDRGDDGWERYGGKENDMRVPFFEGQYFSFKKGLFSKSLKVNEIKMGQQAVYRSENEDSEMIVPINDDEFYAITCETLSGLSSS